MSNDVKENVLDILVMKVNVIGTKLPSIGKFVAKGKYDSDKQNLEKKIEHVDKVVHNTSGLKKKTDYIPDTSGLVSE